MTTPIDFYFDFSSPYGYLASERIEAVAQRHGRALHWHPMLLGVAFKATGTAPLTSIPVKGAYSEHDMARSARYLGIPFRLPEPFPVGTQLAARAFLWLQDQDPDRAVAFAHACYRAYFAEGVNIADLGRLLDVAAGLGLDKDRVSEVVNDPAMKERLKAGVDRALARGVFGSPFFFVGDEPFWGVDRLPQLERWLETGGF